LTTLGRLTSDRWNTVVGSAVFLFTLAVYTITMTPTVPFWDSGEYIATSYILGVPHAPGTPLYVLIGRLFTFLPIWDIARRVNWLSAVSSAASLLFLYLITVRITRKIFPWEDNPRHRPLAYLSGAVAAFMAGFATTFWENAIEAEVYASSCFLMAFVIWLVLRWEERLDEGNEDGLLLVITYLVGLGIGIHLGVAVAAWAVVVFVFLCRPAYLSRFDYLGWAVVTLSLGTGIHKTAFMVAPAVLILALGVWLATGKFRRLAFWSAILFMLGVSVHFFLIIRSNLDPMIDEAAPKTWDALWKMLIRDQYKPPPPWIRKSDWVNQFDFMWLRYVWWNFTIMGERFGQAYAFRDFIRGLLQPPILLFGAGAVIHFLRARRTAVLIGILFFLLGPAMVVYINFSADEVRERDYFFVQNFMFMAIWTGVGAAWLADWVRRQFPREAAARAGMAAAGTLLLAMSIIPLFNNWESRDRRGFFVAHDYAYNMLVSLAKDAIIFTNGDNDTFPLWYIQEVEEFRKDVRVVNLSLLNTDWYIKQLRDLEPKVPITFRDDQIALLRPIRHPDNSVWLVKDIMVNHILNNNAWKRPAYLAVTVPDQMGLTDRLSMEGLVFKINPQKVDNRIDLDATLANLNEKYRYHGLVIRDPNAPNGFGYADTTVYKNDNASNLVQNYAAAFARASLAMVEQGRNDEALDLMERAEMVSPRFAGTVVAKGIILEQLGRYDEAKSHYETMLQQYPRDWQLLFRMGEVLVLQGRIQEAVAYYEQSILNAPPDVFYPYQGLTSVYYQMKDYRNAARVLERWLILHPDDQRVRPLYEEVKRSLENGGPAPGDTIESDTMRNEP
jgi:tetratricopeptide (TPR) repeat protein